MGRVRGFYTEGRGSSRKVHPLMERYYQRRVKRSPPTLQYATPRKTTTSEPWKLTKEEYKRLRGYESFWMFQDYSPSQYVSMSKRARSLVDSRNREQVGVNERILGEHRSAVVDAYFSGKPVPEEVLKDYSSVIEDEKARRSIITEKQKTEALPRNLKGDEFKGLKKAVGAERVSKSFGGAHSDGSRRFGYIIVKNGKWYQLVGDIEPLGGVVNLKVAPYMDPARGVDIPRNKTFLETAAIIKDFTKG